MNYKSDKDRAAWYNQFPEGLRECQAKMRDTIAVAEKVIRRLRNGEDCSGDIALNPEEIVKLKNVEEKWMDDAEAFYQVVAIMTRRDGIVTREEADVCFFIAHMPPGAGRPSA